MSAGQHEEPASGLAPPAFFIVGAPRSGTTLARRLCSELPGVYVVIETHFVERFERRREWHTFPLDEAAIRDVAARLRTGLRGSIDPDRLVDVLGGTASSRPELFTGLIHALGDGSPVLGEKTPGHALHWRTLHAWYPAARFIALVRDPRHQVASQRHKPWGTGSPRTAAVIWRQHNRAILDLQRTLGPARVLVAQHDDLLRDPDAARRGFADFLGVAHGPLQDPARGDNSTGSADAYQQVDRSRVAARAGELSRAEARIVTTICQREMIALGLDPAEALPAPIGDALVAIEGAALLTRRAERRVRWLAAKGPRAVARRVVRRVTGRGGVPSQK